MTRLDSQTPIDFRQTAELRSSVTNTLHPFYKDLGENIGNFFNMLLVMERIGFADNVNPDDEFENHGFIEDVTTVLWIRKFITVVSSGGKNRYIFTLAGQNFFEQIYLPYKMAYFAGDPDDLPDYHLQGNFFHHLFEIAQLENALDDDRRASSSALSLGDQLDHVFENASTHRRIRQVLDDTSLDFTLLSDDSVAEA